MDKRYGYAVVSISGCNNGDLPKVNVLAVYSSEDSAKSFIEYIKKIDEKYFKYHSNLCIIMEHKYNIEMVPMYIEN